MSAGAVFGPVACGSEDSSVRSLDQALTFPQSIASGDPRPTSVVLWTRVVDADDPDRDLTLTLDMATDEAFSQRVALDGAPSGSSGLS